MKILYIGTGYVGTCSAAVSADSGHQVLAYDVVEKKVKMLGSGDRAQIEECLLEEGLAEMLVRNKERIKFTSNYSEVEKFLDEADAVFMCLPTPERVGAEGETDLTYYNQAAEKLGEHLAKRNGGAQDHYTVIVNKSTVPVNMMEETGRIMQNHGVKNFGVVSNPEFLVEGKAMEGSIHPARVVVGAQSEKDFAVMRRIYQRFYDSSSVRYLEVSPREAAAGKLLANYLLFNRLGTTFDVVGRVCESFAGVQFENIRNILITDERIGKWGFYDSIFAGGSCLIKDAASLAHQLEESGANANFVRQTLTSNIFQRDHFYSRAEKEAGFSWRDKSVAVLGVAFKQDTNDVRNSPALDLVEHLLADGVKEIKIYDPAANPMFKSFFDPSKDERFKKIVYAKSEREALAGTQVCLILTDWPQFKSLAELMTKICPPPYLIMDGRRMLAHRFEELFQKGYNIIAVGSPFIKGKA